MELTFFETPATYILMIVTVAISLAGFASSPLLRALALEPYKMWRTHQYHQIITSGFIHGGFGHLAFNMLTLYFMGRGLEYMIATESGSNAPYLIIYFVSMIVGSLYPFFKYRDRPEYIALGASGAISGVVFGFVMARPDATFYIFFALPMPAWVFAILYVGYSIYAMRNAQDNIGHEAHLAGGVGGIIAMLVSVPDIVTIFRMIGINFP